MTIRRKTGPKPLPKREKRVPAIVMLSPNEMKAMGRIRGRTPFSTWARGVLLRELTEDPTPSSDRSKRGAK